MLAKNGEAGSFISEEARARFMEAYDRAFALWPRPWSEFDVETQFATTHVHRYGPADGDPVVLLHGAGFNGSQWYPNVAALGRDHPVFAIDTPGDPGRSIARVPTTASEVNAAWLTEVLHGLGSGPAHLVGSSYGGWMALNLALRGPDQVASLTLLDPAGLEQASARFWWWFSIQGLASLAPGFLRRRLAGWLQNSVLAESALIAAMWAGIRSYRMESKPGPATLTDDELRSIRVPALLLTGQRSPLISPARARQCARIMPRARAEIITGSGHGPGLEQAAFTNTRMTEFIAAAGRDHAR